MADDTAAGRRPWRTYTPLATVKMQPYRSDELHDYYRGTKDALVAAGLAPAELFPGEPGMPKCSVRLMPTGVTTGSGRVCTPGRLTITKRPNGQFLAELVPAAGELAKRRARDAAERETKAALRRAEDQAGLALGSIVATLGRDEVARLLHRLGPGGPKREHPHLRLVWSVA